MTIVAHTRPFVIGVDTHARAHTLAILKTPTGEVIASEQFPTTDAGMHRAITWAGRRTRGEADALWVIEGVATHGARFASLVTDTGYQVAEAPRMSARGNRGLGKSDPLDARRIAAAVLPVDESRLRVPRAGNGVRTALRVLLAARRHMTTERTACVNALTAHLRTFDLGIDARRAMTEKQIAEVAAWRTRKEKLSLATTRAETVRLAKRMTALDAELDENKNRLEGFILKSPAVSLLGITGIGPVNAAVRYAAWSHLERIRSEAAFAHLAGVAPIPASSGNTVRHRLNRGGDRQLNSALYMAVIVRMGHDPETRRYVERRRTEGRTSKEIQRCLRRYLARKVYRTLNATHLHPPVWLDI